MGEEEEVEEKWRKKWKRRGGRRGRESEVKKCNGQLEYNKEKKLEGF